MCNSAAGIHAATDAITKHNAEQHRGIDADRAYPGLRILLILSSAAMPLARMTIRRQRESELRRDLREMRTAIDRYKDAADKNLIQTEVGSQGYPPDLQTLVDGVTVSCSGKYGRDQRLGAGRGQQHSAIRFGWNIGSRARPKCQHSKFQQPFESIVVDHAKQGAISAEDPC